MSIKLMGIISIGSIVIDILPIKFSISASTVGQYISYLWTSRKPMTQLQHSA